MQWRPRVGNISNPRKPTVTPELFIATTELFPDPTFLLTPDGTILAANSATADRLGLPLEGLTGRLLAEFVENPPEAQTAYLRACSRTTSRVLGSLTIRAADGSLLPCRAEGKLLRPSSPETAALVIVRLIPKEAAVAQFLALNERVAQLSREVNRRQLAEAELQESVRRRDEFLSMLAHELRNPLAPVMNGLELFRLKGADSNVRDKALGMINRQVRHMVRFVDDLLDVSRITQGKMRLSWERVNFGVLVQTAVADHGAGWDDRTVSVDCEAPETPVWVAGDATRLNQVVANLLHNACKFTAPGGRVQVRVAVDPTRAQAVLAVSDTGIGIDPVLLPRLFDPFTQGEQPLDRSRGGLGLGLALVKGLTELHGGEVLARSDGPGRGAEFIVRLPLEVGLPAMMDSGSRPEPVGKGMRVVIIEDNQESADSLRALLEVLGHEVRVAYTGPDGVRVADEWRPDVVICDIGLPGLDGYGVAEELQRRSVRSSARLIAITGYGTEEVRLRAMEAGFHHHLTKPADPGVLVKLLTVAV